MSRIWSLLCLFAAAGLAAAETVPVLVKPAKPMSQREAFAKAKAEAAAKRVKTDCWTASYPRGLAADPTFFQGKADGLGIEMTTANSIGMYDRAFALPGKPETGCRITAEARLSTGKAMFNNVMIITAWMDEKGNPCQRDYVAFTDKDGVRHFDQTFKIPEDAVSMQLRLIGKWTVGKITFSNVKIQAAPVPAKRIVRLVTVPIRMPYHKDVLNTPAENLAAFEAALREACENVAHPDLMVLPECTTNANTGREYPERAEAIPGGPTWQIVSKYAAKYKVNIVAGAIERDKNNEMHNVAFICDRQGKLAGIYRKVHLATGEFEEGLVPGKGFPVFQLDFGRIGILICWDNWFAESARMLRLNGAELLVYPIAGDGQWEHREHVWAARAIDNAIPMVVSLRGGGRSLSCIIDRDGRTRAATTESVDYAAADVDLAWQKEVFWLSVGPCRGNPYQVYEFERRPETYPAAEKNFRQPPAK